MEGKSAKFGFWSIVLLGINSIVGTGIFLLPNKAYSLIGSASLGVLLFDALLAGAMALCFAEVAGFFTRNGGPYLYAKYSLGDFFGYEVGVLKWIVILIAWATMAVGFATALGAAFPALSGEYMKNVIATIIIIFLTVLNIAGVNATKILSNIITVSKLVPLVLFIVIGIFYVNGAHFTPIFPNGAYQSGSFAAAAILMFFAYTGYEAIAVARRRYGKPQEEPAPGHHRYHDPGLRALHAGPGYQHRHPGAPNWLTPRRLSRKLWQSHRTSGFLLRPGRHAAVHGRYQHGPGFLCAPGVHFPGGRRHAARSLS
jgi:amino acid transporter